MSDTKIELLSCPFCGASPLEDRIEPHEHSPALMGLVPLPFCYPGSWSIECVPCGFRIFSHDSRDEAVAKWNRRPVSRPVSGEVQTAMTELADYVRFCRLDHPEFVERSNTVQGLLAAAEQAIALLSRPVSVEVVEKLVEGKCGLRELMSKLRANDLGMYSRDLDRGIALLQSLSVGGGAIPQSCPECPIGPGAPCNEQCDAPTAQAREWSGYTIETVPTYYVADDGELRPYENHGLPGDELLCKYSDVRGFIDASVASAEPVVTAQAREADAQQCIDALEHALDKAPCDGGGCSGFEHSRKMYVADIKRVLATLRFLAKALSRMPADGGDTARLEWLADPKRAVRVIGNAERTSWGVVDMSNGLVFLSRNMITMRAAIDAAMAPPKAGAR